MKLSKFNKLKPEQYSHITTNPFLSRCSVKMIGSRLLILFRKPLRLSEMSRCCQTFFIEDEKCQSALNKG